MTTSLKVIVVRTRVKDKGSRVSGFSMSRANVENDRLPIPN